MKVYEFCSITIHHITEKIFNSTDCIPAVYLVMNDRHLQSECGLLLTYKITIFFKTSILNNNGDCLLNWVMNNQIRKVNEFTHVSYSFLRHGHECLTLLVV